MTPEASFYLTKHILNKIEDPLVSEALKFEVDMRIYYYGRQFQVPFESTPSTIKIKNEFVAKIKDLLLGIKIRLRSTKIKNKSYIVSNCYVSITHNIETKNISSHRPPWDVSTRSKELPSIDVYRKINRAKKFLRKATLSELLSKESIQSLVQAKEALKEYYSSDECAGAMFPNDTAFFERLSLLILKELHKPTALLVHGLPGVYNQNLYTHSDHLLVWGNHTKETFIDHGMNPNKIHVIGHPFLKAHNFPLRNSLANVLILGKSMNGGQFDKDQPDIVDRGNLLLYCYMLQEVLVSHGVKQATLRPHPADRIEWYKENLDTTFFNVTRGDSLSGQLKDSTLVIGPTSSTLLEAVASGVNYLVFEPRKNQKDILGYPLVPPFDGSYKHLICCFTQNELSEALQLKKSLSAEILKDFINPSIDMESQLSKIFNLDL